MGKIFFVIITIIDHRAHLSKMKHKKCNFRSFLTNKKWVKIENTEKVHKKYDRYFKLILFYSLFSNISISIDFHEYDL